MTELQRIEAKLDELLALFKGLAPGEVRRKAKADVVSYLQKHKISVSGEHGGEGESKGKVRHRR